MKNMKTSIKTKENRIIKTLNKLYSKGYISEELETYINKEKKTGFIPTNKIVREIFILTQQCYLCSEMDDLLTKLYNN